MILATPFVPGLTDYEDYATALKRKGECNNHVHAVIVRSEDEAAAIDFDGETAELFLKTFCRVVTPDEEIGNTQLANLLFKEAVLFLAGYTPLAGEPSDVPMLYSDPTWRPTTTQWLNKIQSEYYTLGAPPAMGLTEEIAVSDGRADYTLHGPIVIGQSYPRAAALLNYLPPRVHWREYLRHELGRVMREATTIGTGKDAVLKPPIKKK